MGKGLSLKYDTFRKKFSKGEELSHAITHGIGAVLGVIGMVKLVQKGHAVGDALYLASVLLYGITLVLLYTNSSIYHGVRRPDRKAFFEKMDHLSIYLLIAGTYTPFALIAIGGWRGILICSLQWLLAIVGVVFKTLWIRRYQKVHLLIYLAMGWMVVFFGRAVYQGLTPNGFLLLVLGGVAYSVGVLFYAFKWFRYHHLVWHLFVILGSVLHFFAIYLYIY